MRNESATVPTAMPPISFSEKRNQRPKMPLMAAPIRGSRGTSQMYRYIGLWSLVFVLIQGQRPKTKDRLSPLHQINFINPDRFAVAIERDHDAESNRGLSSGDDNDENREYLPRHRIAVSGVLQVTRKGDEVQVRRVQDQLDRHKANQQITACQHTRDADDEKDRGDHQELRKIRMLDTFECG